MKKAGSPAPAAAKGKLPMNRAEKSMNLKAAIIEISRELFLEQGYRNTTIRQIMARAGINFGSLYHFFHDKEDILLHISRQTYEEFILYVDGITRDEPDSAVKYALTRALEFKAIEGNDRVAELYLETYSSWKSTQVMLPVNVERNKLLFHQYNKGFTGQDYYLRTLALRSMRLGFISERVHSGPGMFDTRCPFLIETALTLFNVPEMNIRKAVGRAMDEVKKGSITIHGVTI
jgi:AcrR family transcriptional regulator